MAIIKVEVTHENGGLQGRVWADGVEVVVTEQTASSYELTLAADSSRVVEAPGPVLQSDELAALQLQQAGQWQQETGQAWTSDNSVIYPATLAVDGGAGNEGNN